MTPHELAQQCATAIESGLRQVCIVVPGPPPRGERVRLDRASRRKCPMGEVVGWRDDPPRTVAYFDAMDVLAWLAASGAVEVEARVKEGGR